MKILKVSQIKSAEDNAVNRGIFSYEQLMQRAGESAAKIILEKYNVLGKKVCVVCGCGNNGGDGLVIAKLLKNKGANVKLLYPLGAPSTDTAAAFLSGVKDISVIRNFEGEFDFVIDALFGIGLNRVLSPEIADLIDNINAYDCFKIAIDVPSGVFGDGGNTSCAFLADLTISFSCYKPCHLLPNTAIYCGEVVVADIGLPLDNYAYLTIEQPTLKKRSKQSHKGTYGTALLFCGSYGMCGAEILAAKAALRMGVGVVKALVCDKNYTAFTSSVPEAVTLPVGTTKNGAPEVFDRMILSAISSSNALLLGCGLGRNEDTISLVKRALGMVNIPTVLDADGINAVIGSINLIRNVKAPIILTPHPAEMARLLNTTTEDVEANRISYSKRFAVENGCILVLKGANTIVAAPDGRVYFNITGNSGLATGGSGDVLSGMMVSLLAQGEDLLNAALAAVWLHGSAADSAAKKYSERSIIPSDIIEELKTFAF